MLVSLLGLGLTLAGGAAQAQNWAPAASPYGAWRTNATTDSWSTTTWKNVNPAPSYPVVPTPATTPRKDAPTPTVIPIEKDVMSAKPVPQPKPAIQPVRYPAPSSYDAKADDESKGFVPQLEPPGRQQLFQLESEAALNERMRQAGLTNVRRERITFPEYPPVSTETYPGRHWPPMPEYAEPNYVCYGRLLFEQKNTERYGWDLGIIQPVVSTGVFFADVATLPYHLATAPCRCYECSAGQCLPGDPVPYLLYPPELSATGGIAQAGTVLGLLAIFP
jgi:hypothetical protein